MSESDLVVTINHEGAVATLTMVYGTHNLLDGKFIDGLNKAFVQAQSDGARAIVLKSGLRYFSAGADLGLFDNQAARWPEFDARSYLNTIEQLQVPVIASVHGYALGGGFELALACDVMVAAESSKLGMVEVGIGVHPLMGAIQRVASRAGVARAYEMALFGRRYDAATLERWGIINTVVPDSRLAETTRVLAEELAAGPTKAHAATKRMMREYLQETVTRADCVMGEVQLPLFKTEDLATGLDSLRKSGPGRAIFVGR